MLLHCLAFAFLLLSPGIPAPGAGSPTAEPRTPDPPPAVLPAEGDFIINLYDAFGPPRDGLTHDFGFSALIRYDGTTILFDAGTNADILRTNVEALGLSLRDVDIAVASHAHFDHINGFDYLLSVNPDVTLYFPADFYWGHNIRFNAAGPEPEAAEELPEAQRYFGGRQAEFTFNQSGRFWKADVRYVAEHEEIAPGLTLIATKSPFVGYFSRYPSLGGIETDETGSDIRTIGLPELSLNIETPNGDVLLVGCSHSLVETIVRTTRDHLGRPIGLVYGGYHLLPYASDEIRAIATRMKDELGVAAVAPAHCTGHAGFSVFREVFGDGYRVAGLGSTTSFP